MAVNRQVDPGKSPIYQIVATQFIATLLAAALCLVFDEAAAMSALMAGIVCVVPGLYVLAVSSRPVAEGDPGVSKIVRSEAGKFALTISLFSLVFVFVKPLNVPVFFGIFFGLQLCNAAVPLLQARRLMKR